jgi:hypothetical protein
MRPQGDASLLAEAALGWGSDAQLIWVGVTICKAGTPFGMPVDNTRADQEIYTERAADPQCYSLHRGASIASEAFARCWSTRAGGQTNTYGVSVMQNQIAELTLFGPALQVQLLGVVRWHGMASGSALLYYQKGHYVAEALGEVVPAWNILLSGRWVVVHPPFLRPQLLHLPHGRHNYKIAVLRNRVLRPPHPGSAGRECQARLHSVSSPPLEKR